MADTRFVVLKLAVDPSPKRRRVEWAESLHNSGADLSPRITRKSESFFGSSQCEADDELVDQKKYLEESCQPKCVKPLIEYQACVKRVEGDDTGNKHCTGQYFDYISCVDKCVAPKLFQKLK
ncbi:unnamed protein product [Malus baccata var. baccata]